MLFLSVPVAVQFAGWFLRCLRGLNECSDANSLQKFFRARHAVHSEMDKVVVQPNPPIGNPDKLPVQGRFVMIFSPGWFGPLFAWSRFFLSIPRSGVLPPRKDARSGSGREGWTFSDHLYFFR
jgi:hypothetical protein